MKKLVLTVMFFAVVAPISAMSQDLGRVKRLEIKENQINIVGNEVMHFETVRPESASYMYVDIFDVTDNLKPHYRLPAGQAFTSVRVGRHKNPTKVRIVLQAPKGTDRPEVAVFKNESNITLSWDPANKVISDKDPQPKNLTKVEGETYIEDLVKKVKGQPLVTKTAPPRADIEAPAPEKSEPPIMELVENDPDSDKPLVQEEPESKKEGMWEQTVGTAFSAYEDTKTFLSDTVEGIKGLNEEGGLVDQALAKAKSLFGNNEHISDQQVKVKIERNQPKLAKFSQPTEITNHDDLEIAKASIVDLVPSKAAIPLKVSVPSTGPVHGQAQTSDITPAKNYDKDLAEMKKTIDQRYQESIRAAQKLATEKADLLAREMDTKIQKQTAEATKKQMAEWLKKNNTHLAQLETKSHELKNFIENLRQERFELDQKMREMNSRNAGITCREEPRSGYRVAFLPSGSLRVGLDALAESVDLSVVWDAPHKDYYIDRAILLNGTSFDENLMIIHQSLAQNQVYFMLEPNYTDSLLRVRVSEQLAKK